MWVILLIVLLLLIMLILFLISSSHIIIGAVTTSIPVWGLGLIVGFVVFFALRQYTLSSLHSPEKLAKLVQLSFDGNELNCSVQESEVNKYTETGSPYGLAFLSCLATAILFLTYLLYYTCSFSGYTFAMVDIASDRNYLVAPTYVPENVIFALVCVISIIPIAIAFTKLKANQSFRHSIRKEVERLVGSANLSLKQTGELQSLISQTASLAARAKVHFPDSSTSSIRNYVESHKAELLISTAGLDCLLGNELAKVRDDRSKLETAVNLYENATSIYTDVSRCVNRTGSMPLIKELEYNGALLNHQELKSLLTQKKWSEYHDAANVIIADLRRLKDLAIKYELHEEEYEEFEEEPSFVGTDEEKAYRILDVPPTATNEQIKIACDRLRRAFHPDRAKKTEEDIKFFTEKNQWINWAFDLLKKKRNIL